MTRLITLGFLLVALALPAFAADSGDDILGMWATDPEAEGGLSYVEVGKRNGKYFATIRWLDIPVYPPDDDEGMAGQPKVDRNNPTKGKRSAPIVGLVVMKDFKYLGDGHWGEGTIYDPDNGTTYKCKAKIGDDGHLQVRGFIGFSFIGRTTVWTRYETKEEN